jgi:hypothetical protein
MYMPKVLVHAIVIVQSVVKFIAYYKIWILKI